jgi:hypothetical protein
VVSWAKSQGFTTTLPPESLHVTIAYSREAVEWPEPKLDTVRAGLPAVREVSTLGDEGAVVLKFESTTLENRWSEMLKSGASWDWDSYQPYITISWDAGGLDLSSVEPFRGELVFGPEEMSEIDETWRDAVTEKSEIRIMMKADVIEFSEDQRIVWGWGSVTTVKGKDLVDIQNDVIESEELVRATSEFMEDVRTAKAMHDGNAVGTVLHSLPLTYELAETLGLQTEKEGWIVGVKINDDGVWARVKSGELGAFSIGGTAKREVMAA